MKKGTVRVGKKNRTRDPPNRTNQKEKRLTFPKNISLSSTPPPLPSPFTLEEGSISFPFPKNQDFFFDAATALAAASYFAAAIAAIASCGFTF